MNYISKTVVNKLPIVLTAEYFRLVWTVAQFI